MARRRRKSIVDRILGDLDEMLYDAYEQFEQRHQDSGYDNTTHGHGHGFDNVQQPQPVSPLTPEENQLYIEIVELGFREAVKKYHPDREGGDAEKAACVNTLRDKVRALAGIKR